MTELIADTGNEIPRWLPLLRLGIAFAAIAGIGGAMWHSPGPRAPDRLSCRESGIAFDDRRPNAPMPGPKLGLHDAIIDRLTHHDDFCVLQDSRPIGRIGLLGGTPINPEWRWEINLPLPIPSWGKGSTRSLPEAKAAFAGAWERFYAGLTPDDIAHWHEQDDAARLRH